MVNGAKAGLTLGLLTVAVSGGFWLADRKKKRGGCGARYQQLAVTIGGKTLNDPYDYFAWSTDYEEWKALAEELTALAIQHYDELGRVECERTGGTKCGGDPDNIVGGSYPRWDALVDQKNQLVEKVDDLPSIWTTLDFRGGITQTRTAITAALCLLDRADEGLEYYKAPIPPLPIQQEAESGVPWYAWTALAGAGLSAASLIVGAFVQAPKPSGGTTIVVRDDDDDDDDKIIDVQATER